MLEIAVDTETTGLHVYNGDKPFAISGAYRIHNDKIVTIYKEFSVDPYTREVNIAEKDIPHGHFWANHSCSNFHYNNWSEILSDTSITKIFHNAKFDIKMLESIGLYVHGPIQDTMLAARSCFTLENNYKLKYLAEKYVGIKSTDEKDLLKSTISARSMGKKIGYLPHKIDGKSPKTDYWLSRFFNPKCTLCETYAIQDAVRTLKLWEFYKDGLEELDVLSSYTKEMELLPILIKMEDRGIKLNYEECIELQDRYETEINLETNKVRHIIGEDDINLNSPKQLLGALGDKLGISSTGVEYLEDFREHDEIEGILNIRGMLKGLGYFKEYILKCTNDSEKTFADLPNWKTKVIHGNFNQGNTRTWRLSCNNPNLQNVSNPKTAGNVVVNVRNVFGPRKDYIWYCIDYSGLEMRIFADLIKDQDPTMYDAFLDKSRYPKGEDPHDIIRQAIPELVKLDEPVGRKYAKNVGFCKIFGGGPKALVKYIKPSGTMNEKIAYCRKILEQYDTQYPGIVSSIRKLAKDGEKNGYVENFFGRKINCDPNFSYRACNYIVQSSAADLIKSAMIKMDTYLQQKEKELPWRTSFFDSHIVLSIHDEIVVEVHKKAAFKGFIRTLAGIMADNDGIFDIETPVEVEKTSTTWGKKSKKGLEWLNGK